MAGCTVVEFELMATAAPPGASRGRNPSSSSTVPKKLTDDRSEPARSGVPATPAQVTMPETRARPGRPVRVPAASARGLGDGPGALVGPGEVGHDLGVVQVDADARASPPRRVWPRWPGRYPTRLR